VERRFEAHHKIMILQLDANRQLRFDAIAVTIAVVSLLGLFALCGCREAPRETPDRQTSIPSPDYEARRNQRWEQLLQRAGKVEGGFVLEARPVPGQTGFISISVRNVCDYAKYYWCSGELLPDVLVRNADGRRVQLTTQGNRIYGAPLANHMTGGSRCDDLILSGEAIGVLYPLERYFDVSRPGRYTVLATRPYSLPSKLGSGVVELVAIPLTFEVPSSDPDGKEPEWSVDTTRSLLRADGPSDEQWAALASSAGRRADGRHLEAVISPCASDAAGLAVSLVTEVTYKNRPDFGSTLADYHVLVRDSSGRAVARTALKISSIPEPQGNMGEALPGLADAQRILEEMSGSSSAQRRTQGSAPARSYGSSESVKLRITPQEHAPWGPGFAVGTVIPLTKLFELGKPGDYTALVALSTPRVGKPYWVAEPVKFVIGAKPTGPKK
jgi:hypothetical protein